MLDFALIEQEYGIEIESFAPLRPERGIYRLLTKKAEFVLKPTHFGFEEFSFIAKACAHLAEAGAGLADILPTRRQKPCFAAAGRQFFLMKCLPGRRADYKKAQELQQIAAALARLHQAGCGFHSQLFPQRNKIGTLQQTVCSKAADLERWQAELSSCSKDYFGLLYSGYAAKYLRLCSAAAASLEEYYPDLAEHYLAKGGICHHDLASHNIIIDKNGGASFVDFDYCISDIFVHDLASILLRICRANAYAPEPALSFFEAYTRLSPLTKHERRLLCDYISFPEGFWQLGLAYFDELPQEPPGKSRAERKERLERRLTTLIDNEEAEEACKSSLRQAAL